MKANFFFVEKHFKKDYITKLNDILYLYVMYI